MSEPLDLDAIEARVNKATPGSWHQQTDGWTVRAPDTDDDRGERIAITYATGGNVAQQVADAEFIAHSREDVPALVTRVRELEKALLEASRLPCSRRKEPRNCLAAGIKHKCASCIAREALRRGKPQ